MDWELENTLLISPGFFFFAFLKCKGLWGLWSHLSFTRSEMVD